MAIPTTGPIKMGGTGTNSIAQVKAGTDTGTPSAVSNVSLRGLSVDGVNDFQYTGGAATDIAVAGSSPDQTAPHRMSEFRGYVQILTHDVVVSFGDATGKIGFRTGTITSGADVPFGTINLGSFSKTDNNNYVRMTWLNTDEDGNSNSIPNRDWTSVELPDGTTFNRTSLTENGLTQGLFPATSAQYSSWSSGTWTFTYS